MDGEYNKQELADGVMDIVTESGAEVAYNSFVKPIKGETIDEIAVFPPNVKTIVSRTERPLLVISFDTGSPSVSIDGFEIIDPEPQAQINLFQAILHATLEIKRYKKVRLSPFKGNRVYELTIRNGDSSYRCSRWDDEVGVKEIRSKDVLAALGVTR